MASWLRDAGEAVDRVDNVPIVVLDAMKGLENRSWSRVLLLIATNFAIVITLAVLASVLGLDPYLREIDGRLNLWSLLGFSAVFGFGGALISLALSKTMAKFSTGAQVITQPRSPAEAWLLQTVQRLAGQARIGMPEVAVYDSPEPNAFATGARRDAALVAVSTGLLDRMDRREVEAVLAHEIAHVANGDMVTLTLLQGVLNTFVLFLARVIGWVVDTFLFRKEEGEGPGFGYFIVVFVAQIGLGLLASVIVAGFSRRRELRADAGSAALVGAPAMIAALERLRGPDEGADLPSELSAFGIRGGRLGSLLASHPSIDERIAALRAQRLQSSRTGGHRLAA